MEISEYHPFKSPEAKEKYLKLYDKNAKYWQVPSETKVIDTFYGKTFVRINGPTNALPLVLLHGMNSNSLAWIPNIKSLSEHFRTYAIDDIYGTGRSIYTRPLNGSDDYVEWLNELFIGLELSNNINIATHSYGGWMTS